MAVLFLSVQLAAAQNFVFNAGAPDGRLGAFSGPAATGRLETETADDFILQQTTVIQEATITGLIPANTPLTNIRDVEVEIYHVFPLDSVFPPSGNVPTRTNSPSDIEIGTATRSGASRTLTFSPSLVNGNFTVTNTVITSINKAPTSPLTHGEPARTGQGVAIRITFTNPIILPAGHYFFRPEVRLTNGDFLYLSSPRPTAPPIFVGDLQAWIRNSNLNPDWLRIGTDIVGGTTFNVAFSLRGDSVPNIGTPGTTNCVGKTASALALQFGSVDSAAATLGFSSVAALQGGFNQFCLK